MTLTDYFAPGAIGKRQRYDQLLGELRLERSSFETHWRDLGENISPRRVRFTTTDTNRGDKRNQKIIDTTPVFAARTMRAGMTSGVTSPARPWFDLASPDPDLNDFGPVKQYLDICRKRMLETFGKSNLYQALPTLYGDMGVFGTGTMAVMEDETAIIRCTPFALGEYFLANDDKGRARVFAREFRYTVRQLVKKFGRFNRDGRITDWSNFSQQVRTAWDAGRHGTWIDVVQVVQENEEYRPTGLHAKYKRFSDCYYERGAQAVNEGQLLRESGVDEFPILAGRWELTAGDVYATDCPGMTVLGDVKQLQHGAKSGAQILDKINRPPMVAHTDMRGNKLSQLAGDVTYVEDTTEKQFRPAYDVSSFRFDLLEGMQQQVRSRIERGFFVDLFLLMSQTDRRDITATEIIERKEEKLLALGPMLENLNQDVLDPLIDRTFAIMQRRGEFPEPPKELEGMDLKVDYVSVMAQAQKAIGRSGLQGFVSFVGEIAKVDPSVLDKVDRDQLVDEAGDLFGIPSKIIVPDEKVAAVRQERAKAAQAAQQAATLKDAASGAKTLSEADTGGKNALTDLLGQIGAPSGGAPAGLVS